MRTNNDREWQREDTAEEERMTRPEARQSPGSNSPLTMLVYDWDHALEIATEKMWGDKAPLLRRKSDE